MATNVATKYGNCGYPKMSQMLHIRYQRNIIFFSKENKDFGTQSNENLASRAREQLLCEIARNIARYLADQAVGRVGKNHKIFRKIEQDNCFIFQHIDLSIT